MKLAHWAILGAVAFALLASVALKEFQLPMLVIVRPEYSRRATRRVPRTNGNSGKAPKATPPSLS